MTTTTAIINATPARLRDGSWGARVQGAVSVGATVKISTKAGKSWEARVSSIVWSGEGVTLVATTGTDRAPRASNYDSQRFNGYGRARGGYVRACKTDGNCSSFGSGRSCGGHGCDGF